MLVALLIVGATVGILATATASAGFDIFVVDFGLWAVIGALIVALRPGNAVGWLFAAAGLLMCSSLLASGIAASVDPGTVLTFASWWSEWTWVAAFVCMTCSLMLVPTGRTTSRRWTWLLALYAFAGLGVLASTWSQQTLQGSDDAPVVDNPIGIPGLGDVADAGAGPLLLFTGLVMGLVSLVVRFRRGDADERRRLKLIALAAALMVASAVVGAILDDGPVSSVAWGIAAGVFPVACGVAILRHRLFDVDLVISKALVYGALTVVLGVAYVGLVLVGQAVSASFAGGSNLAIAVSTLVVAALFLPVRSRVQGFVDRRFYRRRYDAQRTLEAFGTKLRQDVELDVLQTGLIGVVSETMQPAHVSVWRHEDRA